MAMFYMGWIVLIKLHYKLLSNTKSVKKGLKSLLVVDMQRIVTKYKEAKNAKLVMNLTKCDPKTRSNQKNSKIIKELVRHKIPVMGHIGFTPQFKKKFKIEGETKAKALELLKEAISIEKAGAFSIVLECLSPRASKLITKNLKIPTIGIGSSSYCDGQILVTDDMLGISGFYPKFVKKYASLNRVIEKAVKKYSREIRLKKFPMKKNFLNGSEY